MRRERILLLALAVLATLTWVGALGQRPVLTLTFLDVGQGDCTLIRTPEGRAVLVDGGGRRNASEAYDIGRRVVVPSLLVMGVRQLQAVICTHPHEDHCGGLAAVIRQVPVDVLLVPAAPCSPSTDWERLLAAARDCRVPVRRIREGVPLYLGREVACRVLGPPARPFAGTSADENNNSAVLALRYRGFTALLTGDIERAAQERLLSRRAPVACTLFKVPHHGSDSALDERLLTVARPRLAVIMVGRNNAFGHPSRRVMRAFARRHVPVYRTDLQGAITVSTNGEDWHVRVAGVR